MIIICSDGMVPEAINKEIYMEIDHLVIKHGWDLAPSFCSGRIIHINNEWPDGDDSSYSGCHIGWDFDPFWMMQLARPEMKFCERRQQTYHVVSLQMTFIRGILHKGDSCRSM